MRLFEILDKLNQNDADNGTANVGICNEVVSVDKKGHNGYVKIGIPGNVAQEIVLDPDKKALMLLIIDLAEYDKLKNGDDWTFVDNLPQAVHVLTYQLRCDNDYRKTWQDNIAMAFKDAFKNYMETNGTNEAVDSIHRIANNAADNFLNTLTATHAGS